MFTRGHGLLDDYLAKKRALKAEELLPAPLRHGRILDIGCGRVPYFLRQTAFREKYGLDPAVENDYVRPGLILEKIDIEEVSSLPFADGFFAAVTMLAVFEHLEPEKLLSVLREIRRVLQSGGRFVMTTPSAWTEAILKIMAWLTLASREEIAEHKGAYGPSKVIAYLTGAGFSPARIRYGYFESYLNSWFYADK